MRARLARGTPGKLMRDTKRRLPSSPVGPVSALLRYFSPPFSNDDPADVQVPRSLLLIRYLKSAKLPKGVNGRPDVGRLVGARLDFAMSVERACRRADSRPRNATINKAACPGPRTR